MTKNVNSEYFISREMCPICHGPESSPIYSCSLTQDPVRGFISSHYSKQGTIDWSLLEGTAYELVECEICGLVYQRNVPNNHVLDRLYNQFIDSSQLRRLEEERLTINNFFAIAGEMAVLFRMTGKKPSQITLLDFGFGHGRWARVAHALGAKVFVTEYGDDKRDTARAIGVEVINDEDIDRMRFDIVHAEQVFEHLTEPGVEFRRLASVTNCLFKVAVPRHKNVRKLLDEKGMMSCSPFVRTSDSRKWNWNDLTYISIQPLEHLNVYCSKTMQRLAEDNHLKIVGRSRKGYVPMDVTTAANAVKSTLNVGKSVAKSILPDTGGYYLFEPVRSAS